ITASMPDRSFAGAMCAGYLSDILGRKHALLVAAIVWVIECLVTLSAQNVAHLVADSIANETT
ncbi:hypothetical protein HOY80DRAFT_858546, partial [Tuber brumale]